MLFSLSAIRLAPSQASDLPCPLYLKYPVYGITVFFSSQHLPHSVIALFLFVHGLSLLLEYKLPGIRGCVFCLLLDP